MSGKARLLEGVGPMAAQEMGEKLRDLADDANSAVNGVSDALGLTPKVEEHPYGMLAAALGVGYVLGGGLFTPTTARIIGLGVKLASVPLVRDHLMDFAETAVDGILEQVADESTEEDAS